MKKFLNSFFVTLGVIFFIIILFISYLFIFDPLNLKPLLFGTSSTKTETIKVAGDDSTNQKTSVQAGSTITLSESQKKALQSFGIDPATIPTTLTAAQETCFEEKLGTARVNEIKSGATPNALEFFSAKSCL
jgi:N-acetylglucosamine-6-phosphate deacetylase